jgi:hypothetical protein
MTDTRPERGYRIGDAIDELDDLPNGSARLVHLDDAWSRPRRCGGMGVEYPTHELETSFKIVDACWETLEPGGWLIADADDWFKLKLENYLVETYGNVAETYEGGGYRRTGCVTYQRSDGGVDRGGAGMYLRNGGYHVVFAHKSETDHAYESARQIARRPNRDYGWKSLKPLEPYGAWIENLTAEGDLVVEPCAGTAPASIEAERLGREFVAIDVEPEAKTAYERRRKEELGVVEQATLGGVSINVE